ncbi:MAG: DNA-binding response regulator [Nocardioidaceae bacterium]
MTVSAGDVSPLSVLGFSPQREEIYRVVLRNSGCTPADLATMTARPARALQAELRSLAAAGLVDLRDGVVVALPPDQALSRLITDETRRLQSVEGQLEALRGLLTSLSAEHLSSQAPVGEPVAAEIVAHADVVAVIRSVTASSSGDLLWMRPDQWRHPGGEEIDRWVCDLLRGGRRSRAIYPARALEDAPAVIRTRAQDGEQVRILAEVPCRMAVLGEATALLQPNASSAADRVLVIRQQAMVEALRLLFESHWERAMPVPGLDGRTEGEERGDRRLLLDQLARGAKDEQIARALGLSLRTVRRRVADLLDDLGADSRFQAGVEAVRRGLV